MKFQVTLQKEHREFTLCGASNCGALSQGETEERD